MLEAQAALEIAKQVLAWEITETPQAVLLYCKEGQEDQENYYILAEVLAKALCEKHELHSTNYCLITVLEHREYGTSRLLFTLTVAPEYGLVVAYTDPMA